MIESTPISVSIYPQNYKIGSLSGAGKIVISENQSYLDIGSTMIPLGKLPEETFSNGENVRYLISNNKITITPISYIESSSEKVSVSQYLQKISDLLNLSSNSESNGSANTVSKNSIICEAIQNPNIKSGVYIFSSSDELISFLKERGVINIPIEKTANLFNNSSVVSLRIEGMLDKSVVEIIFLNPADLKRMASELIESFNSQFMKSIGETFFEEILGNNYFLSTSTIIDLDEKLCDRERELQVTELDLAEIPQNVRLQWLKIALNFSDVISTKEIVRMAPLYKPETFINELKELISQLKDNETYKKSIDIFQKFLTKEFLGKPDFIKEYIESIGFTFEHQLADESKKIPDSVKAALLTLRESLILEGKNSGYSYDKLNSILKESLIVKDIFDVLTKYKEIENIFKSEYGKYSMLFQHSDLFKGSDNSNDSIYSSLFLEGNFTKDIAKITEMISKIYNRLDEFIKELSTLNQPIKISELPLIEEVLKKAEKLYRLLSSKNGENILENIQLQKRAEINTDFLKQQPLNSPLMATKTVESLIDKIESFQLLAHKSQGNNGTYQIITLPVKIGNEWTEINFQLLHSKQKKKGRKSPKFSVSIDIAPKFLGEIHINLDYGQNKKLKLSAEFGKKETYTWFFKHKKDIQDSLSGYGVLLLSLELRSMFNHISESKKSYSALSKMGNIDIKV